MQTLHIAKTNPTTPNRMARFVLDNEDNENRLELDDADTCALALSELLKIVTVIAPEGTKPIELELYPLRQRS